MFPSFADSIAGVPVAVPDKIFGLTLILDFIDRGHSLRQSTSYNAPFSASGKFRLYLSFSSPHKAGFAWSPFFSATGSSRLAPHQGLIANNKTAFFGRQFFVSSDINPLWDLRYTPRRAIYLRCDMRCGAWGIYIALVAVR